MSESQETPIEQWSVAAPIPAATNGTGAHLSDELLAAWTADELASDERATVEGHLTSCGYCRNAVEQTQYVRGLMRASTRGVTQSGASMSIADAVLARVEDGKASSPALSPARREEISAVPVARAARNRRRDGWRRAAALAAALLLVICSALIFTRMSPRGQTSIPTPTMGPSGVGNIPGNWASVLPTGSTVSDVAVVSPTDIWAVGSAPAGLVQQALLMHFDGISWRLSPDRFLYVQLISISMTSASDGWAVGAYGTLKSALLHYSGGHWHDARASLDTKGLKSDKVNLTAVRMASPTAGWALGQYTSDPQWPTTVFQYSKVGNSYRWEPSSSLEKTHLASLSVVSDHEVWSTGFSDFASPKRIILRITITYTNGPTGPYPYHWDTHSWELDAGMFSGVSMLSSTDGWAAGSDESGLGLLYHWDGQQWARQHFVPDGQEAGGIAGIAMTGTGTGWVYGRNQNYLYSTANGQWFGYPLGENDLVVAGAPISSTAFLAIVISTKDQNNLLPVPVIFEMSNGRPLPTPTPLT